VLLETNPTTHSQTLFMHANSNAIYPRKGGGGGHGSSSGKGGGSSGSRGKGGKGGSGGGSKGSPAASKGAPKSFTNSRYSNSFKLNTNKGKSSASPYSDGGGKSSILSSGIFSGRLSGGGQRTSVYGTRTYGSGYPYGSYGYYVSNRPFPYVFIPVPIHRHYYGSDQVNIIRFRFPQCKSNENTYSTMIM